MAKKSTQDGDCKAGLRIVVEQINHIVVSYVKSEKEKEIHEFNKFIKTVPNIKDLVKKVVSECDKVFLNDTDRAKIYLI